MYYEHFGLTQAPFRITPNTEFFFSGGNRGPVLEALIYAITHGEGIVKVSGEVGSGKTMLCNMLQNRLPPNVQIVYLANPSVAPEEVLHAIAFELGLGVDRDADRLEAMHLLQDYLVKQHALGQRVVLFIEESQSMPLATLEEIRLLSNLETRTDKLLQMVLFGQPELDEILRRPDIRQLRDRIAHSFRLDPLSDEDVREYLMFRMRAAGYRGPEIFSPAVVKQIAKSSSGLTRRVNLIADKALLAAFSENTHTIEPRHVEAALRDTEFGQAQAHARWQLPRYAWAAAATLGGAVIGALVFALVDGRLGRDTAAAAPANAPVPASPPIAAVPPAPPSTTPAAIPASAPAAAPIAAPPPAPAAPPRVDTKAETGAGKVDSVATAASAVSTPAEAAPATPARTTAAAATTAAEPAANIPATPAAEPVRALRTFAAVKAAPARNPTVGDVIAKRLDATQDWLKSGPKDTYSIQLLVAHNEQQLRNNLKALPKYVEMNDIYMYRSSAHGRPAVNVLWGSFDSRQAALEELEELPSSLRANRPYVRTLEAIRQDVDRSVSR